MAIQFRDTQFGRLVRLLSSNRALRYPDIPVHQRETMLAGTTNPPNGKDTTENEKEAYLIDWHGQDDPENPQNWSRSWKLLIGGQICLMNWTFYIASSIYTPGELSIMREFGVSETVATLGLSVFSLGYGFGPMLWSPLSEIPQIGRSDIYFFTTLAFVLLQLPIGYAVNMPMFLVFRAVSGFVGSPALATGGATISDLYQPAQVAYGIAFWGAFGICGPVFGPVIGGFAAKSGGWRLTIWIISWLGIPTVVALFFFMPETNAATILHRRAKRVRAFTGDLRYKSQSEIDAEQHKLRDHLLMLGRAFTLTFSEPIVFALDLYSALLYGILFTWFESFPLVFGEIYGFDLGQQGLVFIGLFVSTVLVLPLFLLWIRYKVVPRFGQPNFRPELVLPPTFFGAAALPVCLLWYGWSARGTVHWIVPVVGSSLFSVSIITLFNPLFSYLGIAYPDYMASIFAGNSLFRATSGAIFPLFARSLFDKLGVGGGNSLLAGIACCFAALPFVFYRYGPNLRRGSKNARQDV